MFDLQVAGRNKIEMFESIRKHNLTVSFGELRCRHVIIILRTPAHCYSPLALLQVLAFVFSVVDELTVNCMRIFMSMHHHKSSSP